MPPGCLRHGRAFTASATATAKVVYEDVNDPNNEGLVLSESPPGGTQAKPNTTVTLTVGRYRGGQTTTTTPTTPTTTSPQPPPVP